MQWPSPKFNHIWKYSNPSPKLYMKTQYDGIKENFSKMTAVSQTIQERGHNYLVQLSLEMFTNARWDWGWKIDVVAPYRSHLAPCCINRTWLRSWYSDLPLICPIALWSGIEGRGVNSVYCALRWRSHWGKKVWVTGRRFTIVNGKEGEEGRAEPTAGHRGWIRVAHSTD